MLAALEQRMAGVGLQLHPDKTRIVYCKDGKRRGADEQTAFTFLGYTFRARNAPNRDGTTCSPGSCPRSARTPSRR